MGEREGRDRPRVGGATHRRALLKASAGLAAALLAPLPVPATTARQAAGATVAADWVESERVGLAAFQAAGAADAAPAAFQADFPFYAVAPHWSGETAPGASVEVSLSADGQFWSDPIVVGEDPDSGRPGGDRRFGRLVATPGASFVRYRTFDASGQPATLPGFTWSYFDASVGPAGSIAAEQPSGDPRFDPPPIISRADWGCDEGLRFKNGVEVWPVAYHLVEHVIVHHSDTMNFEDPMLAIRSIYYYHAVTRGWGDIGYNYVVDFLGNVYEGRYGGENAVGGHALGYNAGSCGICTMGRFAAEQITPEMRTGLTWIVAWATRTLDPVGEASFVDIPELPTICAHRDVNPTTCPGDALYGDLEQLREDVRAIQRGRESPAPPAPQFLPGDVVVTVDDGGTLREEPTVDAEKITPLPKGEALVVADGPVTNDGHVWYAVQGATLGGWIAADLLAAAPDAPAPATEGTPSAAG